MKLSNTSREQECTTCFTSTYHPVVNDVHIINRKSLRSAVNSIEKLQETFT